MTAFIKWLNDYWDSHGTKIIGWVGGTIQSALLIEGLIPAGQHKYWQFAGLLLCGGTVYRGHTNTKTIQGTTP